MKKFGLFFIAAFFMMSAHSQAQEAAQTPIEITATKAVEWQRNSQQYIARDNVIVTQGSTSIRTDLLIADYREGAQSSTEIWQMTADGNVIISDDKNTAYGDKGVYDVSTGVATLTGQNLKLVSPDQTITARDSMQYFSNEKKAIANGNAKVVRTKDTLTADRLIAFFKQDDSAAKNEPTGLGGSGNLDRLEAHGRVVIKTPAETLYGDKAIYKADTNTAELIGNVRVERDKNVLEGGRAEVNLTTSVSKMFAAKTDGGRVRGVFFPSAKTPVPSDEGNATNQPITQ